MDSALQIVEMALTQARPSGLAEALCAMAKAVHADGCILWERTTHASTEGRDDVGRLFVLAQSFDQDQACAVHDLPLQSVTGEAIATGKTQPVPDIDQDIRVQKDDDFFLRTGIKSFYAVPLTVTRGVAGSLNFYYRRRGDFHADDVAQGERLAHLIPPLYRATTDTMTRKLLVKLNETLRAADEKPSRARLTWAAAEQTLQQVCRAVAETFECLDASVVLTDPLDHPGTFRLMGTTWRRRNMPAVWTREHHDGLTAWVLQHKQSLLIQNLGRFESDRDGLQRRYPGLTWGRLATLQGEVRRHFGALNGASPLLTFMAAPVLWGDGVLGAVRCALTRRGGFLSARESWTLGLVAGELGRWWAGRMSRRQLDEENRSWRKLVAGLRELNRFVHGELNAESPNEASILKRALGATAEIIADAQIMDMRLVDQERQDLYFAETFGKEWASVGERLRERFPIDGRSAGAQVVRTGRSYVMRDVKRDRRYSLIFPNTKRMIIAPLGLDKAFGVIDIRGTGLRDFPPYALTVAELLGQQIGLYHNLIETIRQVRAAEKKADRDARSAVQAAQDLAHQLKGPVLHAHLRAQAALDSLPGEDSNLSIHATAVPALRKRLYAVRGLCGKAQRVTLRTALYAAFASGARIPVALQPADDIRLAKMLVEASRDNAQVVEDREVHFSVDVEAIRGNPRLADYAIDYDLIEQAVNNLLDNAGKYSYSNTTVRVSCGFTRGERLAITVANKGIPLTRDEARHCLVRDWRGERATRVTGEGTGIGLWVVDNIMRAVGGEVIVLPTEDDVTEFKLVFAPAKDAKHER